MIATQLRLRGLPAAALLLLWASNAHAIPYFARKYSTRCSTCHILPPMLNERGLRFVTNGYRLSELSREASTVPVAVWTTQRLEADQERETGKGFPNRLELISSDSLAPWLSYFVEWRAVSYQNTSSGRLLNRSGRFEDLFLLFQLPRRFTVTVGQFRMLNQWDVSRRLTLSEPAAFSAGVPGGPSANRRLQSLRSFSLAGRAPAVRASWHAPSSGSESDGWFHEFTVPLAGEFSIPLGKDPKRNASFELEGRPKGLLYETYYRRSLSSLGGSLFAGDDRWLTNLTGTLQIRDQHLLASVGTARFPSGLQDFRLSVSGTWVPRSWIGAGVRLDHQSARRVRPAVAPHLNFSVPGSQFTFLVTVEQRIQKNNLGTAVEVSAVF